MLTYFNGEVLQDSRIKFITFNRLNWQEHAYYEWFVEFLK